jgi:hypothetical protein
VINVAHRGSGLSVIDRFDRGFTFVVSAPRTLGGVVDVPTDVTIERVPGGVPAHEVERL